jgi:hypothetical protein
MVKFPSGSAVVESAATPEPLTAIVPSTVLPLLNVTEPVGVPTPGAFTVTVAVSVSL